MSKDKTHWKKLTNPDYIGAYSLQPGEERTVEIVSVERRTVTGSDGKKEECTVAILKNEKPFILNSTNCKTLTRIYSTPYIEDWSGKSVIIYAAKVKAFGEEMEALRIKNVRPSLPELTPGHHKWNDAIASLKSGKVLIEKIEAKYALSDENRELLIASAI